MKNLIILVLAIMSFNSFSQNLDLTLEVAEGDFEYTISTVVYGDFTKEEIPESFMISLVVVDQEGNLYGTISVDPTKYHNEEFKADMTEFGMKYFKTRFDGNTTHYLCSNHENIYLRYVHVDKGDKTGYITMEIDRELEKSHFKILNKTLKSDSNFEY